jgi:hypothetical protein
VADPVTRTAPSASSTRSRITEELHRIAREYADLCMALAAEERHEMDVAFCAEVLRFLADARQRHSTELSRRIEDTVSDEPGQLDSASPDDLPDYSGVPELDVAAFRAGAGKFHPTREMMEEDWSDHASDKG